MPEKAKRAHRLFNDLIAEVHSLQEKIALTPELLENSPQALFNVESLRLSETDDDFLKRQYLVYKLFPTPQFDPNYPEPIAQYWVWQQHRTAIDRLSKELIEDALSNKKMLELLIPALIAISQHFLKIFSILESKKGSQEIDELAGDETKLLFDDALTFAGMLAFTATDMKLPFFGFADFLSVVIGLTSNIEVMAHVAGWIADDEVLSF